MIGIRRLYHPQHGYHVPVSSDEEAALLRTGWGVDDGALLRAKLERLQSKAAAPGVAVDNSVPRPSPPPAPEPVAAATIPAKRGPGRPRKVAA